MDYKKFPPSDRVVDRRDQRAMGAFLDDPLVMLLLQDPLARALLAEEGTPVNADPYSSLAKDAGVWSINAYRPDVRHEGLLSYILRDRPGNYSRWLKKERGGDD